MINRAKKRLWKTHIQTVVRTLLLGGARYLLSSNQSKRVPPPLSPEPSTNQAFSNFPPVGAALPAPTAVRSAFRCLPSFLETKFNHDLLHLSLRGLRFRCQLDSRPNDLISCSTFRRRWCCIHNRPVSILRILFQSKSWRIYPSMRC